ncbi:MAG: acyl-CoA mutase large subunit family protein [Opitutales bacterium]|nr:acyl-CoA mutase large subunit family protein [Opitutales bacterium]
MNDPQQPSSSSDRKLLSQFPPHSYEQWKEAAEVLLKGRSFEKTLITPTYEGFDLQPIYLQQHLHGMLWKDDLPGLGSRVRGMRAEGYREASWLVSQELSAPTPDGLNALIHEGLGGGQDELNLWLDSNGRRGLDADAEQARTVGVCGVSLSSLDDLSRLLRDVRLDWISIYWRSGLATGALAALYFAYVRKAGFRLRELRGAFDNDPLGLLAEGGSLPCSLDDAYDEMAALTQYVKSEAPGIKSIGVQGHVYHNGGASSAQELAYVLATGVEYLSALSERGLNPAEIAAHMRISLSVGPQFFVEIAKFRAFRMLWNRVLESFGVAEADRRLHLHARTGLWNKTLYDPYVNMLRTTTEAFSAVVGGCDSLHVGPFDEVIRESDTFSRRIARNTHAILSEECHLSKVVDPAGGSWAVESLTAQMAEQAWKQFQEIEAGAGMADALDRGIPQAAVESMRSVKLKNMQKRKDVLVGSNVYPMAGESRLDGRKVDYEAILRQRLAALKEARASSEAASLIADLREVPAFGLERMELAVEAARRGATLGELHSAWYASANGSESAPTIPFRRAAEDFERLRTQSENWKLAKGEAPVILQLNYGPSRAYRIRADWTSAFFQTGGFKVLNDQDFNSLPELLVAVETSNASVAVLTSDDETYAAEAVKLAQALKQARPHLYLLMAGAPGEREAELRAAGFDDFVHVRVNNYEMNEALLERVAPKDFGEAII